MAEVVAGLLTSALVNVAKDKLVSAIAEQASLCWNFGKDLEEMKDDLETISAVLVDAERRSVKEELVRLLLKRLKDAAIDINDMLEDYQDTSDRAKAKISGVLSCLPVAFKNIAVANRMKSLREKLTKIRNEIGSFKFINGNSITTEQTYDERETTSYLPKKPLIGRDGEKQEIINLLSANTNNDDEIVIVAIYGLGGLGKSTLAQLVYNDAQFKNYYDYRIWVYVSQDFNLNKIGSSIISQLSTHEGQQNMGTQQAMKKQIDELLDDKKVLVILDDLWEEKENELDKLRTLLHIKGSKVDVIVTTRNENIATKVSTGEPYILQNLEDNKCWEIIKGSSNFEVKSNKEEIEKVGLDIAKKCGGVALAAQAVGSLLRSKDLSGWIEINNSGIWNESSEDHRVLPSLKLSYERMPPQLRICFSYCSIFPKGYNIIEDELIQQWTALDFIEQSKGKEFINRLLGMSFLQFSNLPSTSQRQVVQYTMHDLVHDLARLTAADQLLDFDVAQQRNTHDQQRNTHDHKYYRYLLLRKCDGTMKLANMPSKLRAIRLSDSGELDIPSGAFSFAKYLRILDFSECSGIMLPTSIGRLKQLRCLIAPRMKKDSLPECITELSKLQYLNINQSSKITELPRSISKLGCLKYLCLSGCSGISKFAESFGDLKLMVHLDMSACSGLTELPDSIGNLTHLQHLDLSGCSSLKAIPEPLCGLTQLQYLNLSSCEFLDQLPEAIGSLMDLRYLKMTGCRQIRELPESLMKLQKLLHLDVSGCRSMQQLGRLRGLTTLQHLDMSELWKTDVQDLQVFLPNLTNLKYLSFSNIIKESSRSFVVEYICRFTNLEHLDLSFSDYLTSLPESIGNLQRLHTLHLSNCRDLKFLPESIGNLQRLHTLHLSFCPNLSSLPQSICTLGLKSLQLKGCQNKLVDHASSLVNYSHLLPVFTVHADEVNGCSNLRLLEGVHHASELRIRSLENVKSLEEATKVKLSDRHDLSKLTLSWTSSTVRKVQNLKDKDLLEQLVPPRGLRVMRLEGYSCTSFPDWLMCIYRHLTNLVSIQLHNLPTCTNLPPLGQLPHLEKLTLFKLPRIERIDREFCGGKGAFRQLLLFHVAYMKGLEEWNTIYSVEDSVEEFMFPVLDTLKITNCRRLRLKPCPPAFRECDIRWPTDQVISSLEHVDKTSHHCTSSSQAIKIDLSITGKSSCQSIRIFHHFPTLRELRIHGPYLKSVPESIRRLTSLESLELDSCKAISALPEWLSDLSSLKRFVIIDCAGVKSLPASIQQLTKLQTLKIRRTKLQKLEIRRCWELKDWCESEENKTKLAHISNVQLIDED